MTRAITSALGIIAASVLSAGEAPRRFSKSIETSARTAEELISVRLDSDVYAASAADLSDLRIISGNGDDVPFLVRTAAETAERTQRVDWTSTGVELKPTDEDELEIRIALDKDDRQPDGLALITPLSNFEKRVRVYGVLPGGEEQLLAEDVVFDYSRFMDVRRQEIALPQNPARKFRIVVGGLTADQESQMLALTRTLRGGKELSRKERTTIERRPFRIDRIEWWTNETKRRIKGNVKVEYPVEVAKVDVDRETQRTLVEIVSRREPLEEFRLLTPSRNFSRNTVVETAPAASGEPWRELGRGTISRFEFRDLQEEHLEVDFPVARRQQYRIAIENRDSPPLKIDGVTAIGEVHQILFLADPETSFSLAYGGDGLESPNYDLAAIRRLLDKGVNPLEGRLGPQSAVSEFVPPEPEVWDWINDPWVIGGVVVLLVAVLGWMLYLAGKRIERRAGD